MAMYVAQHCDFLLAGRNVLENPQPMSKVRYPNRASKHYAHQNHHDDSQHPQAFTN